MAHNHKSVLIPQ